MLLRFGAANYFSIRKYCELSLIASKAIKDQGVDLLEAEGIKEKVLPVAVIYGANASGKTTLHIAMRAMRDHVISSFSNRKPTGGVPRVHFGLDADAESEPTVFDCDFITNGVRYHYGFEFDNIEYKREWLYSFPDGHRRVLFERDKEVGFAFGRNLKGKNRIIEKFVRSNSLFISTAAQHSHEQLTDIFSYFEKMWDGVGASDDPAVVESFIEKVDPRVVSFLGFADTGVVSARVKQEPQDEQTRKLLESIRSAMSPVASENGVNIPPFPDSRNILELGHKSNDGSVVYFKMDHESRGTIRLVRIMTSIFDALDSGGILSIDEIDSSLHPLIVREILKLFSSNDSNKSGAQLIATTHDTNLVQFKLLRRDQIWFCEKSDGGETRIYPLTDIRTRNTDDLEKGYLSGRFGGVPYLMHSRTYVG